MIVKVMKMLNNQRIWIVLVGSCIFSLSGMSCQELTNNSELFDIEKELIESLKEYEKIFETESQTTAAPINRISTSALVKSESVPVADGHKYSHRPYLCQEGYQPCKYFDSPTKSIQQPIYKRYPSFAPMPVHKPIPLPTFTPWKAFKPYTWSPLPLKSSIHVPSFKHLTSPQIPVTSKSKHSTIGQHQESMSFPYLTMPINGKRNKVSSSPYIYISNKFKTMYLSADHKGATQIHDVGNTKTSSDFNLLVINECHNCPNAKITKEQLITQPRAVPSDNNSYVDTEFQALLQLVKEEDENNSNDKMLKDRQAILNRPYDTQSNNIVDGAELVANPSRDQNSNLALENSINNVVPEGTSEGFKSSNISIGDENHNGFNSRKKRSADEIQTRQIPGDMNSAVSGLSQPSSINSGQFPSSSGSLTQPNSIANTGMRPGDNLSSGGGDSSGPTIPGSVGVPASRDAVAPQNPASPFQSNDSPWWRSLNDLPVGKYTMAVIVTEK